MTTPDHRLFRHVAIIAAVVLVVAGLYFAREVLIPLTFAAFLTFLLTPAVRAFERLHIGRVAAVVLVASASIGTLGAVGWLMAHQASALVADLPGYEDHFRSKVRQLGSGLASLRRASDAAEDIQGEVNKAQDDAHVAAAADDAAREHERSPQPLSGPASPDTKTPVKVEVVQRESPLVLIARLAGPVVDPLVTLSMSAVFLFFFLTFREDLRDRLVAACGQARIQITTATVTDSARRVTRFFAALAICNAVIGTVIGTGFYFMGIPKAMLWGLLAAILRFVPYVGATVAALFPAALAAAIFDGWMPAIVVLAWTILIDVLAANFLEPWLFGSRVGASPTGVVCCFVFWSWLWGGAGFLLAIPITVSLIVLGRHVPAFELFHVLLGNEPVLEPKLRLYQRLLAADRIESAAVVKQFAADTTPTEVFDTLVLPALAQVESDRTAGLVEQKQIDASRHVVHDLIDWFADGKHSPTNGGVRAVADLPVLVVLDRGAFDDLLPEVLRFASGIAIDDEQIIPAGALVAEVVDQIVRSRSEGILFLAIEPRNTDRILHILRRLQQERVDVDVVVGLFVYTPRGQAIARRLQRVESVEVVRSLADLSERMAGFRVVLPPAHARHDMPTPEPVAAGAP